MQALSTLGQAERLKVLEHLYELLCLYEACDGEVSTVSAELDHYKNEKIAIRKKPQKYFLDIYVVFRSGNHNFSYFCCC